MMAGPVPLPGGPILPLILSSPVLSLSPSPATCIHLHTAPNLSPALSLVRIPLCLYPSPLEHGSRQWGDRHNSSRAAHGCIPLLLVSLHMCHLRESHANFPMTSQTVTYMLPPSLVATTILYHTLEIGIFLKILLVRYSLKGTTVFFHVL